MEEPVAPAVPGPARAAAPRLPTAYYPGPAPVTPMAPSPSRTSRLARGPGESPAFLYYECESDESGSSDDDGEAESLRPRRVLLALALAAAVVLTLVILCCLLAPRALARGLARCGWTVYLLEGCEACRRQARLLPGFGQYVLCGSTATRRPGAADVPAAGLAPVGAGGQSGRTASPSVPCSRVPAFPFWHNARTGESRTGYQDRAALQRMAEW